MGQSPTDETGPVERGKGEFFASPLEKEGDGWAPFHINNAQYLVDAAYIYIYGSFSLVVSKENVTGGSHSLFMHAGITPLGAPMSPWQGAFLGPYARRVPNCSLQGPILRPNTPTGANGPPCRALSWAPQPYRGPNRANSGPNACMHNNLVDPLWVRKT